VTLRLVETETESESARALLCDDPDCPRAILPYVEAYWPKAEADGWVAYRENQTHFCAEHKDTPYAEWHRENEDGSLKCYLVESEGVYLGADTIVFARTEGEALELASVALAERNLKPPVYGDGEKVKRIPMSGATVIWDGDY